MDAHDGHARERLVDKHVSGCCDLRRRRRRSRELDEDRRRRERRRGATERGGRDGSGQGDANRRLQLFLPLDDPLGGSCVGRSLVSTSVGAVTASTLDRVTISFARGVPAPECLPVEELADCAKSALEHDGKTALSYAGAGGYEPLRRWVAERHGVELGRVLLTNGSLQGFVFVAQHLLATGACRVLVEAPTYDRPLKILAGLGAEVVALPLDEIARERGLLVLEDDPYGLVRFEAEPAPTLFELAGGDGVVYASSFSKTVAPGVRVGYLVLPDELARV